MIQMNAFTREPEQLIQEEVSAVERVIRSGWWILGNEVKGFEAQWAEYSRAGQVVGVANGMDALEIGLRAMGIQAGDEVITTPMTAFATVLSIMKTGATPVFADINADTGILDPLSVARCITPKTKAVMVVHLYGQAAPLDQFKALCDEKNIHFIEDCAQAHGAKWNGTPVGSVGVFAGWSFYPTKNLGTVGDAGALSTLSPELAEKARVIRNYGQSVRYHHPVEGMNSRLDELHAAILSVRLKYLDAWTEIRRKVAHAYELGISNPNVEVLPLPVDHGNHVHHLFVMRSKKRDAIMEHLKNQGVESLIHYPVPAHFQVPCKALPRDPKGLSVTELHAQECFSIPCNPFLQAEDVSAVIRAVNSFQG